MSESIEFQRYLESIRATYQERLRFYTPTDAAGKQQRSKEVSPFFDFNLIVQMVKREERERQEEEIERLSVLEGLRKYADQQVLLVGRPGSGKSTALARLMLEEATNPRMGIPVLVELRYWQGSIEQLICNSLKRHGLTVERLEAVLSRLLLLFDGVNELPSEEARSQLFAFRRDHPKLPMIFTTRDLSLGGDLGIEKKLEMQPLTEAQMRGFIRAYLPEQAERMLRQLKDQLREFGQTPLLLWMLCSLFRKTGTIPENLGLVFREFTQGYERYLKEDVRIESDKAWWKPVLQQLAWVMMQGEKPTEFRVAIGKEEAVRAIRKFLDEKVPYAEDFARKCLRDLQKHHLIQTGTNPEELEFRHQLIQEYYAASALLDQLPALDDEELKRDYLNFLKWTEAICLMLSLTDTQQALRVVKLTLDVDLILGMRVAQNISIELPQKILDQAINSASEQSVQVSLSALAQRWSKYFHAFSYRRPWTYELSKALIQTRLTPIQYNIATSNSIEMLKTGNFQCFQVDDGGLINPITFLSATADPELLPKLRDVAISQYKSVLIPRILKVMLSVQTGCKYYNYEIYQAHLTAQKHDRQMPQNSDHSHTIINNYPNVTEVKQTIMSNSSKYNFPNAQKVQIFEQVNTYIENNHPTDPEIKTAIADLTLLLTQLQTQHPQVTTESQALTVLDAEFTEIQQSTTHPLITLRQQLLNPERHLQAIKATLAEVAKHYLEESVWSKAAITYFDKLSETPDQGA